MLAPVIPTADPFAAKAFLVGVFLGILAGALLMERMWFLVTRRPWGQPKRRGRRGRWI